MRIRPSTTFGATMSVAGQGEGLHRSSSSSYRRSRRQLVRRSRSRCECSAPPHRRAAAPQGQHDSAARRPAPSIRPSAIRPATARRPSLSRAATAGRRGCATQEHVLELREATASGRSRPAAGDSPAASRSGVGGGCLTFHQRVPAMWLCAPGPNPTSRIPASTRGCAVSAAPACAPSCSPRTSRSPPLRASASASSYMSACRSSSGAGTSPRLIWRASFVPSSMISA